MTRAIVAGEDAKPIRNHALGPVPTATPGKWSFAQRWHGSGSTGTIATVTGATDGPGSGITTYTRKTWTGIGANTYDVGLDLTGNSATADPGGGQAVPVVPGQVFTVSVYVRLSKADTGLQHRLYWVWRDAAGATIGSAAGQVQPAFVANAWQRWSATVTAPAGAAYLYMRTDVWLDTPTMTVGTTLDTTGLMVTDGPTLTGYYDGDKPGWRWLGTPGASESTGYPKLDVRNGIIVPGPIYASATDPMAGTFSSPPTLGPTGAYVKRLERVPGTAVGWGVYIAADLPVSGWGTPPLGGQVRVTWWERGNYTGNRGYQIINDGASQAISNNLTRPCVGDGEWHFCDSGWTYTLSSSIPWRGDGQSDQHRFRTNVGAPDNLWLEWSDVRLYFK